MLKKELLETLQGKLTYWGCSPQVASHEADLLSAAASDIINRHYLHVYREDTCVSNT